MLLYVALPAQAHTATPGRNSVNADHQILYLNETRYDTALAKAVSRWNSLNAGSGVHIARTTDPDKATLKIYDVNNCSDWWAGKVSIYRPGMDTVQLNVCKMKNFPRGDRMRIVTHELGHTLNFDHNDLPATSIMYPSPASTSLTHPGPHDEQDYNDYWIVGPAKTGGY